MYNSMVYWVLRVVQLLPLSTSLMWTILQKKKNPYPLTIFTIPLPQPPPLISFHIELSALVFYINGIIQYMTLCLASFPFGIFSRLTHATASVSSSFLLTDE
jgi:hypothetical protein